MQAATSLSPFSCGALAAGFSHCYTFVRKFWSLYALLLPLCLYNPPTFLKNQHGQCLRWKSPGPALSSPVLEACGGALRAHPCAFHEGPYPRVWRVPPKGALAKKSGLAQEDTCFLWPPHPMMLLCAVQTLSCPAPTGKS